MTRRERSLLADARDALDAGDVDHAVQLLESALDDGRVAVRPICLVCGQRAWPGEAERHLYSSHFPAERAA